MVLKNETNDNKKIKFKKRRPKKKVSGLLIIEILNDNEYGLKLKKIFKLIRKKVSKYFNTFYTMNEFKFANKTE